MGPLDPAAAMEAAIRNDCYMVRLHSRGARSTVGRVQRQMAIRRLGLTVRAAFNRCENFEGLLIAIVDGLRPRPDEQTF